MFDTPPALPPELRGTPPPAHTTEQAALNQQDAVISRWYDAQKIQGYWKRNDDTGPELVDLVSIVLAFAPNGRHYCDAVIQRGVVERYLDGWEKERTRLRHKPTFTPSGEPVLGCAMLPMVEFITSHRPVGWTEADFAPTLRALEAVIRDETEIKAAERAALKAANERMGRSLAHAADPNTGLAEAIAAGIAKGLSQLDGTKKPQKS